MKTKNLGAESFPNTLGQKYHNDDKIKCFDVDSKTQGRKFKEKIFSSLALILNFYAYENYLCDNDNVVVYNNSISRAYVFLKNAFTTTNSQNTDLSTNEIHDTSTDSINKTRLWYPSFIRKYLEDCQRINEISLCRKMTKITLTNPQLSCAEEDTPLNMIDKNTFIEHHQCDLVRVASVLIKLKKYLKQRTINSYQSTTTASDKKDQSTNATTVSRHSNKGIQCSKSTEFLKVSPDLKFFSRSSLVINVDNPMTNKKPIVRHRPQQPQHRWRENTGVLPAQSLEYVANYKPESRGNRATTGLPNLRCFSSSAIFGLQSGDAKTRRSADRISNISNETYNGPSFSYKSKQRRKSRPALGRLRETIKRTEDEMLRYSSFIEDDLISFYHSNKVKSKKSRSQNLAKDDILSVKKILLEDYITEVKEIIRSESEKFEEEREAKILESVKKRMDEDLEEATPSDRTESWHSIIREEEEQSLSCKSKTSYVTAEESVSRNMACCCCHCCGDRHEHCNFNSKEISRERPCCCDIDLRNDRIYKKILRPSKLCCLRKNDCSEDHIETLSSYPVSNKKKIMMKLNRLKEKHLKSPTAKSSQSVDSGVLMDFPRYSSGDWQSSDDSSQHVLNEPKIQLKRRDDEAESSCGSCSDEVLCQRVESAVRKFTEELILCERRARDRSRSNRKRWDKRRSFTPKTDQSSNYSLLNYFRNSHCSSEDEHITGISTPSLVSLSDSEILPSPPTTPT